MSNREETDSKRTCKKQMRKRFTGGGTKKGQRNITTNRGQACGCVKNRVGHLPGKIDNRTIKVKKEKLMQRGRPVDATKKRKKNFSMQWGETTNSEERNQ